MAGGGKGHPPPPANWFYPITFVFAGQFKMRVHPTKKLINTK